MSPGDATPDQVRFDADHLTEFATSVLTSYEVPQHDAELVADSLVVSDLWGHPSHGLLRLSWYVARLRSGVMAPVTEPVDVVDLGALCVIDGRHGVGQVVTERARVRAVERARVHGVGVVGVRNSNHFGTAAYFTRRTAEQGCVSILTTNGSPAMAPWGGASKTVGANPWSIAMPAGRHGVAVLDIANTGVARGKVYSALQKGMTLPDGWAMTADGRPTNDPLEAIEGLILPMAGHKGYAISFMMDALSGVLTGSSFGTDIAGPYVPDRPSGCGHLLITLDVAAFGDTAGFETRMEALIDLNKSAPLAAGFDEVFFPGEIENRALAANPSRTVQLPTKTVAELAELADAAGVSLPHQLEKVV